MCGKVSGPTGNVPVVAVSEVAHLPGVSVWAVDCCAVHPCWSDVEVRDDHRFVLVRGGRFVRRIGRRESMADTTVAYLGVPGEVEQFAHPAGGDRCTSISVRPELWRAIAGDDWTLGRSDVYVDARVDLLHRRLLRAGRTGDVHFALAEEVVRLVAVAALAASRARSCSHRRGGIPDHAVAAAARAAVLDDEPGSDGLIPLAERFGYRCVAGSAYTLFIRDGLAVSAAKRSLVRRVILRSRADRTSKWVRSLSMILPKHAALTSSDSDALLAQRRAAA